MLKLLFKNKGRNYVIISQIINALIALILGKLIAIYILPEDFGIYNLYFATYTFFATLLISPTIQFIKASNLTILPKLGSKFFAQTLIVVMLASYILLVIFFYTYYQNFDNLLLIIFLFFIPLTTTSNVLVDFLNVNAKLKSFSIASIIKSFGGLFFISVYFIFKKPLINDVQVLWLMQVFSCSLILLCFAKYYTIYKSKVLVGYSTFLKKFYRFTLPLIFLAIWAWINGYFDRFAIEYFLSAREVGIYNASYGVGSKFFILLSPVFMTILTPKVYAVAKKSVKKQIITKYLSYYIIIALIILIGLYYLKDLIGSILLSNTYKEGFYLIFWVALAFAIINLTYLFELYFYAEGKTKVILIANMASAIINISMNIFLIPQLGLLGAAVATCIGFTIHFIIIYFNFRRI